MPKKFFGEFKDFVMKGNVMNLAVGVIIGAAFQRIVSSLVNDIVMPVIGLITGGVNFNNQFIVLKNPTGQKITSLAQAQDLGATTLNYGSFISFCIDFLIMAFVVFLLVKFLNKLTGLYKSPEPPAAPATKKCPFCKSEIDVEATRCPHCTSEI